MHRIVVLRAGSLPQTLVAERGDYGAFFSQLLGPQLPRLEIDIREEPPPASFQIGDIFVITGSDANAYGPEPWIGRLESWIRECPPKLPLLGVCFGHQIIAKAFGGEVARSPHGPILGEVLYDMSSESNVAGAHAKLRMVAWHYDQVVLRPPAASVIARNAECPIAMLSYSDRSVLTVQAHPELPAEIVECLRADWRLKGLEPAHGSATSDAHSCKIDDARNLIRTFFALD